MRLFRNILGLSVAMLIFIDCATAQPTFTLKNKWLLPCDFFDSDPFGNLYTVDNYNIKKIDSLGKVIAYYDQSVYGKIASLDISNPLKIMVYYAYRNKVQFLDRSLSPVDSEIDFFSLLSETISGCCTSYSNGIWAFSESGSKLFRLNQQAEATSKFENINQWLPEQFKATQLLEYGDYLYIGDPNHGIVVFDRWGSLIHKIPITYTKSFSMVSDLIFYPRKNSVYYYNPKNFEENLFFQAADSIKQTVVTKSNLYIQMQNDSIFKYAID